MPSQTRRSKKGRKTRKGGGVLNALRKSVLGVAALSGTTGATGKMPLGQGTSYPVGPYGSNLPAPNRGVNGLSVLPQDPTPNRYKNRVLPKGRLFPTNVASMPWPQSPETRVNRPKGFFGNMFASEEGTRYTSAPEIQTWNPYLRGDPEEVVDYYEGFSNADRKARMNTEGDGGKVKRKNTPMWKAAMRHSADLPSRMSRANESDAAWKSWAEKGRSLGMNIPLNDPRSQKMPPANWANVPEVGPGWFLKRQLYHHDSEYS